MTTDTSIQKVETSRPVWWTWRNTMLVTIFIALLVSVYLSYVKATDVEMVCVAGSSFDCGTVQNSVYAEIFGVPIAWLGLAWNLLIMGLLLFEKRGEFLQTYAITLTFGAITFGFLYSVYLVYLQAFVIEAFCQWCLIHEALYTVLMIGAAVRLRQFVQGAQR